MTMVAAFRLCNGSVCVYGARIVEVAGGCWVDLHLKSATLTQILPISGKTPDRAFKAYPSAEGWDPFYGYGRLNVEGSVIAVQDGRIPPIVSIRGGVV